MKDKVTRSQIPVTPRAMTIKHLVIEAKLNNPHLNLRQIAEYTKTTHGYARKVWSIYCRKKVTKKGEPFPFFVKTFGFWNEIQPRFYYECPIGPSDNRNLQKVYSTPYFSFVIHKNGSVFVYPFTKDWRPLLRDWLLTWMDFDMVELLLSNLVMEPRKHVSFYAPGVPTKYRIKIKGIGTFSTDRTPFPKGTMEYEMDPFFERRLNSIEKTMKIFAEGMKQHMALIQEIRTLVMELRNLNKKKNG